MALNLFTQLMNRSPEAGGPTITKRDFLVGSAAFVGGLLVNGHESPQRRHTHEPRLVVPQAHIDVQRKLAMNNEESEKLWSMGPEAYSADLRRRGQQLLAESDPAVEKLECVDERQMDGVTDCLAGLGVHTPELRASIASETIQGALTKYNARIAKGNFEPVLIELTWHGDGMCGAALLACKQESPNVKEFTPAEIDKMAEKGALLLQAEILRQLAVMGKSHACRVVVKQVDSEKVLKPDGHPAKAVLLNAHPDLEFNRVEEVPLLTYGTSVNLFHRKGIKDAVLSGKIMMGRHGKDHVYGGHGEHQTGKHDKLTEKQKPHYVVAGPIDIIRATKEQLIAAIKEEPQDVQETIGGRISLWPIPVKKK
jgi:hypothetical protein